MSDGSLARIGEDVSEVLSSKYAYHSTLYRQQDMFASSGVSLTRSTLCDIVKASAGLLVPLVERMRASALKSSLMWTDDTIVPMVIPGGTQRARFWTYIGDQQHPYDVCDFTNKYGRYPRAAWARRSRTCGIKGTPYVATPKTGV